jgi:hypothetical protein
MTDAKDNSSLPLLLSISGAVLLVAVGGWFFLDQEEPVPATTRSSLIATSPSAEETNTTDVPLRSPTTIIENEPEAEPGATQADPESADTDAELRKVLCITTASFSTPIPGTR